MVDGEWPRAMRNCVRMLGVEREVNCAYVFGILCVGKDLLPGLAAVEGAIDAALGVRFVDMAEGGDVDAVWVGGIDDDLAQSGGSR
jgi:hypothetical protein